MSHIGDQEPEERIDESRGTFDLHNDGIPAEERQSGTAGLPAEGDVPPETIESIEQERAERLDPEHRPANAEIDNTGRTFDAGTGKFTDNPEYDESERPYADESGA